MKFTELGVDNERNEWKMIWIFENVSQRLILNEIHVKTLKSFQALKQAFYKKNI